VFLNQSEIEALTGRVRPAAQMRALEQMGIPFLRRPQGARGRSPVVLRSAVEGLLPAPATMAPEPRLRLP
jgi:hypothetical protein